MRTITVIGALALLVSTSGCVSRSRHRTLEAELGECKTDKLAAQEASQFCNRRYAREVERWDDIQEVVEEVLPQTVRDFESERDRIVALMPEEVQREVDAYLSDFATSVARGFDRLTEQNREILAELELLQEVGERTRSIDETVTERLRDSAVQLEEAAVDRRRVARQVAGAAAGIIDEIQGFDRNYLADKGSPDRLQLRRRQRETLTGFHDQLVRRLIELRDLAGEGAGAEGAAPTAGVGG